MNNLRNNLYTNRLLRLRSFLAKLRMHVKCIIKKYPFELKDKVMQSNLSNNERNNLIYLLKYNKVFADYVNLYLKVDISLLKQWNKTKSNRNSPILICVVKNDLERVKLLIEYYKNIGINRFCFLDDKSDDGTREFLLNVDNVALFESSSDYSTVVRQIWINKIINFIGYNNWYVVVDSDEFLELSDNFRKINDFIDYLETNKLYSAKAIMVDLFSKNSLYYDIKQNFDEIFKNCNLCYPCYYYEVSPFEIFIKGGGRKLLFDLVNSTDSPVMSKYPIFYAFESTILINSHFSLPEKYFSQIRPLCVLKHYKFLAKDRDKFVKRAISGNFYKNSSEYKAYIKIEKENLFQFLYKKMIEYKNINDIKIK